MNKVVRIGEYEVSISDSADDSVWVYRVVHGAMRSGRFAINPEIRYMPRRDDVEDRAFSKDEEVFLIEALTARRDEMTLEDWQHYFARPDHHRLIDDPSKRSAIETRFNPAEHWGFSVRLQLLAADEPERPFDRDFVNDAMTAPTLTPARINAEIEAWQEDFFTYDNPPDRNAYFREAARPVSMVDCCLNKIELFEIEGLDDVYLLEADLTRVLGKLPRGFYRTYIARDGDLYRPFRVPDRFVDNRRGRFTYIQ